MNIVNTSKTVGLVLLLSGAGCGTGSVGPLPAEPEADADVASAQDELRTPMQAKAGNPLPGLSQADQDRFAAGKEDFEEEETPESGLGPVFNETSCARCHTDPAVGGGSALVETRFGARTAGGTFDPLKQSGGSLIQAKGIGAAGNCNFVAETVPPAANLESGRRTTPSSGWGWWMRFRRARSSTSLASRRRSTPTRPGGWRRCTTSPGTPNASVDSGGRPRCRRCTSSAVTRT